MSVKGEHPAYDHDAQAWYDLRTRMILPCEHREVTSGCTACEWAGYTLNTYGEYRCLRAYLETNPPDAEEVSDDFYWRTGKDILWMIAQENKPRRKRRPRPGIYLHTPEGRILDLKDLGLTKEEDD